MRVTVEAIFSEARVRWRQKSVWQDESKGGPEGGNTDIKD